jgi:hypothetical protein
MSPRSLLLSLAASSAVLLGGCTSGGQSLNLSPSNGPTYYFRGNALVDTQYIDRYACADSGLIPTCSCTSKVARYCDCRC